MSVTWFLRRDEKIWLFGRILLGKIVAYCTWLGHFCILVHEKWHGSHRIFLLKIFLKYSRWKWKAYTFILQFQLFHCPKNANGSWTEAMIQCDSSLFHIVFSKVKLWKRFLFHKKKRVSTAWIQSIRLFFFGFSNSLSRQEKTTKKENVRQQSRPHWL